MGGTGINGGAISPIRIGPQKANDQERVVVAALYLRHRVVGYEPATSSQEGLSTYVLIKDAPRSKSVGAK